MHDDRFILSEDEKADLADAMNEFSRYHQIPVMSPAWASRIGLATSLGVIVAARVEIVTSAPSPLAAPPAPVATGALPVPNGGMPVAEQAPFAVAAGEAARDANSGFDWFGPEDARPN